MKTLRLLALLLTLPLLRAADDPTIASGRTVAALRAADDARVAAMIAPKRESLTALLSDDLRYAHSNGLVDSKTSLIDSLLSGQAKYLRFDYEERNFTFPAPGVALMTGRFNVKAEIGGTVMETKIGYLGVWRLENDHWRFLAWQSCKLPPAPAK